MLRESRETYFSPDDDVQGALLAFVQTATQSRNMSPRQPTNDLPYALIGNAVAASDRGDRLSAGGALPHIDDGSVRQARVAVMLPWRAMRASLPHAVLHILALSAEEQMSRVEARGVVAAVTDQQARRRIEPQPEFSGDAMHFRGYSVDADIAITVSVPAPGPVPTAGVRINRAVTQQARLDRQETMRTAIVSEHRSQSLRCRASGCSQHCRGFLMSIDIISRKHEANRA